MRRSGSAETVLLGGVVVMGTLIALGAGAFAFNGAPDREEAIVLFGGAALGALAAWVAQWRSDNLAAVQVSLVMTLITGGLMGSVVYFGEEKHPLAAITAVASAIGFVAGLVFFLRTQFGQSVAGNPLEELFTKDSILELGGLQFVVNSAATSFGGALTFVIQNCVDGPRTLLVTLGSAKALPIEVGPLAVVRAVIPIAVPPHHGEVDVRLHTMGASGPRVRRWIGRTWQNSTSTGEQVAMLALGVLKWGGGLQVRFAPGATDAPAAQIVELTNDPMVRDAIIRTGRRETRQAGEIR